MVPRGYPSQAVSASTGQSDWFREPADPGQIGRVRKVQTAERLPDVPLRRSRGRGRSPCQLEEPLGSVGVSRSATNTEHPTPQQVGECLRELHPATGTASSRHISNRTDCTGSGWIQSGECNPETSSVTAFRPSPEISESWRIDAPARCATRIMSSRIRASLSARSALRPTTTRAAPTSPCSFPLYLFMAVDTAETSASE
jgi:hypothetical protein